MMKRTLLIIFMFCGLQAVQAQHLNSYQYVIIPAEFDFQKETNQFQLNELLKFLFEKEGFEAFLDNEPIPSELSSNSCKGLRTRVRNESGMFRTRLYIELRDCNNNEVFVSREGVSRVKDFEKAYQEALRAAFESISELNYTVEEEQEVVEVTAVPKNAGESEEEVTAVPPGENDKEVSGELEKELPEEGKKAVKDETRPNMSKDGAGVNQLYFIKDEAEFFLEKIPSGYNLYQRGMAEPFASLIRSSTGESFIYSSVTSQGMATFDKDGNLTVEVLDPESNNLRTTVYKKRD